jgi:hypothetical protein
MPTHTRQRTIVLLLGGLLLAVGTPVYLGLTRPGMATYLLNRDILLAQSAPYFLAAAFWLPWTSPGARAVGQWLALALLFVAAVLYLPAITGLVPVGGDMVGLGAILVATVTSVSVVVISLIAGAVLWLRARKPPVARAP